MNHPVISVFSICYGEAVLKNPSHILRTTKLEAELRWELAPASACLLALEQSMLMLHLNRVFLSVTYSLMHWGVWIWIFFCPIWWSVTSGNSAHCHLCMSFSLWAFHSDKLHVVVFIKAKRHSLSHLGCNTHLQWVKTREKHIIIVLQLENNILWKH